LKHHINQFLRRFGYEIRKGPIAVSGLKLESDFFKKHSWLKKIEFKTIIDIGANQGQFASRFRVLFPTAQIYSFEPIPEIFSLITRRFEKDPYFKAFNLGLGDREGSFDFFQNEFSDSSSFLPMKSLHKESFPFSQNTKLIQIPVDTLDQVAKQQLQLTAPLFIKIDVQGFEKMVIQGGKETLKKASLILVEVSFQELYENQHYFESTYSLLKELGFSFIGNYDQLLSPKDGSILQADALFINQSLQTEVN
jgi:FkbM family methyltransferase